MENNGFWILRFFCEITRLNNCWLKQIILTKLGSCWGKNMVASVIHSFYLGSEWMTRQYCLCLSLNKSAGDKQDLMMSKQYCYSCWPQIKESKLGNLTLKTSFSFTRHLKMNVNQYGNLVKFWRSSKITNH